MVKNVRIADYRYDLPQDRIAQYPLERRDHSNLLIYKSGNIQDKKFYELAEALPENALLILNNTRVIPARIPIYKSNGVEIEVFLLHPTGNASIHESLDKAQGSMVWECLVGNKKRWKQGEVLEVSLQISGQSLQVFFAWEDRDKQLVHVSWNAELSFPELLDAMGKIPLPPYMDRVAEQSDLERYQTVFSRVKGAVAAPTASLHFTENSFEQLKQKGMEWDYLTLHVGAGTFLPVKVEHVEDHPMHREQVIVSKNLLKKLSQAHRPIVPVGTTALRALESLHWAGVAAIQGLLPSDQAVFVLPKTFAYEHAHAIISPSAAIDALIHHMERLGQDNWVMETELLIMPGYDLKHCQALVTNFHQPESTLMVLVAALIGEDWRKVYAHALAGDYRFLSYGDASLLYANNSPKFS